MRKDWKAEAVAVLRADLHHRSGADGDDSLRAGINAGAVRALARLFDRAGQVDGIDGGDMAALLTVIADNMERADLSAQLAAVRAA